MAVEFCTSVASNLVLKLGECLFAPIGRQFEYVLCYKSYVEDLKKGVKDLNNARERVQCSVDEALNDGKLIFNDVNGWLESVKKEVDEAENLLKDDESSKNACFCGWLPNPMVRHPLGRKVKKMTQVIQGLHDESTKSKFQKVYHENPPIGIVTPTTSAAGAINDKEAVDDKEVVLESRAKIIDDVMKAIVNDKYCVIGVHGPGGVGKSKLLEDVEKRVKKEQLVNVIAVANVSRNPDLKTIQGEIADALGLKLMNMESARGRANRLRERLECDREKNILIILDNLWKKLELKDVGIPCDDDNKVRGCKLLLSSRYKNVLRRDMGIDQEFRLNELNHGEARRLFERKVGDRANDPDFKHLVDGVVMNCGGLPLSIRSVAKRLKYGVLADWRNASINRDLSDAKLIVELSYNDLEDDTIRSVFLICALLSGHIPTRYTLPYCMGWGLYKKFKTIEDARDGLILDIHKLQDTSLLPDGDYMDGLRMHDIFVDMAISIASTQWNALAGREDYGFKDWSNDELKKCAAMSFYFVGIDKLPEKLDCPNLRMLFLCEDNPSLKIPESFFESTEKLQVLDFTRLSFNSLPSSIECLENLKSLSFDHCHMGDVTNMGKLKRLQFLIFHGSVITKLSKEISELTELRFLDLTGCTELKIIEPGVLGSLVNLEELYMEDSFDRWEAEDEEPQSNASLAELKNMKKLRTLYIAIPYSANLPKDLPFGKLSNHKIQIGDVWDWSGEYIESKTLKLKVDSENLPLEKSVVKCLQKTQDLHLDGLQDGIDSIHHLCFEGFQELKHIHVQNSSSLKYVIRSSEIIHRTAFTRLESLFLKNLSNFEKISCGCLALESFSKLKIVKVDNCGEIKHLFPLSLKRTISQLEEIQISRCHFIQEVLINAEADEDEDEIDDDTKVISCNLRRLTLQNLPEMTTFCKTADHSIGFFNGQQVVLPWLESLTLSELPKLKEIWNSQFPSDVSNLRFLNIEDCASLLSIFPSNLVTKLQNLEAITVEGCQLLQKVFDLEGLIASGDVEILLRLTSLTLRDLPSLGHVWSKNPRIALCFQHLRILKVQKCENLRFLFSFSMAKALQQIKEMEIVGCKLLEDIIDVKEEESEEGASINTLEFPLLTSLSLKELPNFRTFSYGSIRCPTLTRLWISGCPKMMMFSSFKGKQQSMTTDASLQQGFGRANSSLSLPAFFDQNVCFPSLEELTLLSLCWVGSIWHNKLSEGSFCKLTSITVRDGENLSHIFPSTSIERFQSLKTIEVVECTSLEALVDLVAINAKKSKKRLVFSNLKEVKLWDLPRLNALVTSGTKVALSLPSLTNVSLCRCHSLRYLFTNYTSRTLDKLEVLDVFNCSNMQEVVVMEESEKQNLKAVKFSRLQTLNLCSLKSLISFSSASCAYEFPYLQKLSISECTELKAFILRLPVPRVETMNEASAGFDQSSHPLFDEKVFFPNLEELKLSFMWQLKRIWHNKLHNQSCKLASLTVEFCENLSSVFPLNLLDRLQSLNKIEVVGCASLEALFEPITLSSEKRQKPLVLNALKKMKLWILPRMTNILKSDCEVTLAFPSLMEVNVRRCHSLMYLFSSATAKNLDQLAQLDVSCCNNLRGIIAGEEGKGTTIETLNFQQLGKLKLGHLKNLISFRSTSCDNDLRPLFDEKLAFPKLEELHIEGAQQEDLWNDRILPESFCRLKILKVKQCHNLINVIPPFMWKRLLQCLESLTIQKCPHLRNLVTISMANNLGQLQHLSLSGCGEMEYIVAKEEKPEEAAEKIVISHLVTLYLHNMPKLKSFYKRNHISEWPSLEEFTIENCKAVEVILGDASCMKLEGSIPIQQPLLLVKKASFPRLESLTLAELPKLEEIWNSQYPLDVSNLKFLEVKEVASCVLMEEIMDMQEESKEVPTTDTLEFPLLTSLSLLELPNLRTFSHGKYYIHCPSLTKLTISSCPKMMTFASLEVRQQLTTSDTGFQQAFDRINSGLSLPSFFNEKASFPRLESLTLAKLPKLEEIWNSQYSSEVSDLKFLEVKDCTSLLTIIPSNLPTKLQNLEAITVEKCQLIRQVFDLEELIPSENVEILGRLTRLTLNGLPRLEQLWNKNPRGALCFQNLRQLKVQNCENLRFLFSSSMAKALVQIKEIEVARCVLMEEIMDMQENESEEVPTTDSLEFPLLNSLSLLELPNLKTFSHGKYYIHCPSLTKLTISSCPKMMTFASSEGRQQLMTSGMGFQRSFDRINSGLSLPSFFNEKVFFPNLEELNLSSMCELRRIWHDQLHNQSFCKLASLTVELCENLSSVFTSNLLDRLQSLNKIEVVGCASLEELFEPIPLSSEKRQNPLFFNALKKMKLLNLPRLTSILKSDCKVTLAFPSLMEVNVRHCHSLTYLFSSAAAKNLDQLAQLDVSCCNNLRGIIAVEEGEVTTIETLNFQQLGKLKLSDLENLISFRSVSCANGLQSLFDEKLAFPKLEELHIEGAQQEDLWNDKILPESFCHLKILKVKQCYNLINVIPPFMWKRLLHCLESLTIQKCPHLRNLVTIAMAKNLGQLQYLSLGECGEMEYIVAKEEEKCEEAADNIVMSHLVTLYLHNMPKLKSFYQGNHISEWPALKEFTIENCKAVEVILGDANCRKLEGSIPILRPLLLVKKLESLTPVQIKETEVASSVLMEEIMDMQEEESEEVPTVDTLEFPMLNSLSLLELPNLKTFSHGKYYIHCPSLTKLTISSCPKMMTFASFEGRQQLTTSGMGFQKSFDRINSGLSLPSFFNEKVLFPNLEELKLLSMCQLRRIWHDQLHNQSFCKLASLTVELCENLSSVFPSNLLDRLQGLNKTEVVGCASLEALFELIPLSSKKRQKPLFFNALEKMKLLNLPRLTSILKSDCKVTLAFPSLMEVNVRRCHSLTYLFSSATAKNLDQLAQLDVSCCNNLRGIIAVEEGEATTIETLNFQQLGKLKLSDLENLISFRSTSCAKGLQPLFDEKLAFPKLEELHIKGAQQEDLWNDKILPESFCRLKILKVKQCYNLINVIPPFMWKRLLHYMEYLTIQKCPHIKNLVTIAMAKNLGQLQHLSLSGCGEMEYIVAKEEEKPEEAADNIVMSHLFTLYLHNMPKLKSFYQGNHISEWPALKEFTIENCKAVEVILGDANCRKLEGSIPILRPLLLVKKVEFPNVESMKISQMDNMKKIWLDDLASNAFSKLKTLIVEHCEKLPSIFSSHIILTRFQNLEELTVTNCESLEVVGHSQEFDISETRFASDFQLRKLVLKRLPKMKHVWSGLAQGGLTFGRLKHIEVVECENLKSLFPSLVAKSMTQLEDLKVRSCGVEEIIAEEDGGGTSAGDSFFPQLTRLTLRELPKLKNFFRNSNTLRWPLLEHLQVEHCGKMRSFSFPCEIQSCQGTIVSENQSALFSFEKVMPRLWCSTLTREDVVMTPQHYTFPNLTGLALTCYHDENVDFPSDFLIQRFPNLEYLAVACSSFEEIFPGDASGLGEATPRAGLTDVDKPLAALRNLSQLYLNKLYNLRRVWKDGSLMAEILNQIEYLWLEECPSLSILFPSPISFQRLTELEVEDCVGLVHVMTCSAATSLVHLESLTLTNCGAIEEVVTDDGNGATEISFPGLSSLTLDGLPSLESFSSTDCAFRFPSLRWITVKQCPKLNIFCKGALRTPELHKLRLFSDNDYEERWEGDLNTTIRTLST